MEAYDRRRKRMRRLRLGGGAALIAGIVIALVVVLSGSSPKTAAKTARAATSSTSTAAEGTTSSSSASTTSSTELGTPITAPVAHTAVAPTCPPATPAGAPHRVIAFSAAPPLCIASNATYDATVTTDVGTFVIQMKAASSVEAVNNFVFLSRYHFYNDVVFHRVIPGFVVQGGSPTGTATGGPGYSYTGNTPPKSCTAAKDCYPVGGIAMANSGAPSSNGSQFFIVLPGGQTTLDSEPNYTLFGQVISGMNVVEKIGADGSSSGTPKVLHHMESVAITEVAS
jgi:cyclophilin family peptidyl-prolyl cis-trans isomerase